LKRRSMTLFRSRGGDTSPERGRKSKVKQSMEEKRGTGEIEEHEDERGATTNSVDYSSDEDDKGKLKEKIGTKLKNMRRLRRSSMDSSLEREEDGEKSKDITYSQETIKNKQEEQKTAKPLLRRTRGKSIEKRREVKEETNNDEESKDKKEDGDLADSTKQKSHHKSRSKKTLEASEDGVDIMQKKSEIIKQMLEEERQLRGGELDKETEKEIRKEAIKRYKEKKS